jgi:hypothetical protein
VQFVQPDILIAAKGLSFGAAGFLAFVGLLLWAFGWRWHRFWVVFGITLAAGIIGLGAGQAAGGQQVMIVGILLAVSAGMLALELAKVLSFVTGGVTAWVATQLVFPQAQELWAIFLAGGLLGVVLYRLWTMLTTSFLGVLVTWHAGLTIAQDVMQTDLTGWLSTNAQAVNGAVIAVMLLGVLVQSKTAPKDATPEPEPPAKPEKPSHDDHHPEPSAKSAWWRRGLAKS